MVVTPLKYWFWLGALTGLSARQANQLINAFGNPYEVYRQPPEALARLGFVTPRAACALSDAATRSGIEERIAKLEEGGIQVISPDDARYPKLIIEISDPPPVLFMRGDAPANPEDRFVAVVGSRRPTAYGISVTKKLVAGLADYGFTIVSGMAMGVDAIAHESAIEAGARTVAFLGCGVERPYPAGNRRLMDAIVGHGAVYSEYPPGTAPYQYNFPQRNRLISGMSLGVVVIEASERSGSLITARFAGEQGRDVFAVPGNITSPLSRGSNALLRDGAMIATSADDIALSINHYISFGKPRLSSDNGGLGADNGGLGAGNKMRGAGNAHALSGIREARRKIIEGKIAALDKTELRIVRLLQACGPQDIDEIAARCGIKPGDTVSTVITLEIKGLLHRMADGKYEFAG